MGAHSKIEWTDHTWNPWIGCTKVAAGCAHCYAESFAKRYGKAVWGPGGTRVKTSDDYWKRPLKWNAEAKAGICPDCRGKRVLKREVNDWGSVDAGTPLKRTVIDPCQRCGETGRVAPYRARVFCASLADLFEDWGGFLTNHHGYELFSCPSCGLIGDDMQLGDGHWEKGSYSGWEPGCNFSSWILRCRRCDAESPMSRSTLDDGRRELFRLIDATPNIDWLLLTKRPENVPAMISCGCDTDGDGDCARPNVWLGTSIACQADADRNIPLLLRCRELSPVLFLSCEPLVGPVDLTKIEAPLELQVSSSGGLGANCLRDDDERFYQLDHHVDWVIVGGESGHGARPMHPAWVRSIRDQCLAAGVAFFFKQWGEWLPALQDGAAEYDEDGHITGHKILNCSDDPIRVGKKAAGRQLDGRTWDQMPEPAGSVA